MHAPLRPMSRKEKRLRQKPWISNKILLLIKIKNQLFKHIIAAMTLLKR